jgi:hypothetical protein
VSYTREVKEQELRCVCTQLDPGMYERLERACDIQQHSDGQLERILLEWALHYYEKARSVETLYAMDVRPGRKAAKR